MEESEQKLRKMTKDFLWVIGNQTEKIPGHLKALIDELYPSATEESKCKIAEKIKANLKNSL